MDGDTNAAGNSASAVETGTGAATSFEFTNDSSLSTPTIDTLVPDAYKEKQWVKNLTGKPVDEIFKKVDNLESMIGQRTINFPAADAPPEQVQQFRKQLNIPETPDKYGYTPPTPDEATKDVWAEMAKVRDLTHWQKVAHQLHLTPTQFQTLVQEQEQRVVSQYMQQMQEEQQLQQQTEQEEREAFDQLANQAFGAEKERALDTAKRVLVATVPNTVKPFVARLNNESLIVLAAYIHSVHKQDNFNQNNSANGGAPLSELQIRESGQRLQAELKGMLDKGVQGPKIRELEQRIKETYAKLNDIRR